MSRYDSAVPVMHCDGGCGRRIAAHQQDRWAYVYFRGRYGLFCGARCAARWLISLSESVREERPA